MNNLQLFENPKFGQIRVVQIDNKPMFCLADVCRALDLTNPSVVKQQIDNEFGDDLNQTYPISDKLGRIQQAIFITEPQLYFVMNRSDKPQAKPFRMWVNSEVLPSIRKHGAYLTPQKIEEVILNPDLIIGLATKLKEEQKKNQRLQIQNQAQAQELQKQAPKVAYYDEVLQSESTYNINQIAKELGMSAITLNKILYNKGVQYKQGGTWLLYHKYQNKGYTKTDTYTYTDSNGVQRTSMLTVWTEKGREFIHSLNIK